MSSSNVRVIDTSLPRNGRTVRIILTDLRPLIAGSQNYPKEIWVTPDSLNQFQKYSDNPPAPLKRIANPKYRVQVLESISPLDVENYAKKIAQNDPRIELNEKDKQIELLSTQMKAIQEMILQLSKQVPVTYTQVAPKPTPAKEDTEGLTSNPLEAVESTEPTEKKTRARKSKEDTTETETAN